MGILIGNGTRLYRRNRLLVRTPLTVTLGPDEMAWYSVADIYKNAWPYGGFVASGSRASINSAGATMRDRFISHYSPSQKPMIWRKVQNAHKPENIFYQGAWAPSVGSANEVGEAYMQLGAYHFVIPPGLAGLSVTGARLQITHGGEICCYQSAQKGSSKNFFGINYGSKGSDFTDAFAGTGWAASTWEQHVGIWEELDDTARNMMRNAQTTIALSSGEAVGSPTAYARIWISDTGTTIDGCIPVTTTPYVRTYALPTTFVDFLNQKGHGWIATIPQVNSSNPDRPAFLPTTKMAFYWLCESHWGYRLELDMG